MTKTRHVLGLSGGKDSAALAIHMDKNYPNIPDEYFFTDSFRQFIVSLSASLV